MLHPGFMVLRLRENIKESKNEVISLRSSSDVIIFFAMAGLIPTALPVDNTSFVQVASCKLQVASCKLQVASCKLQFASCKFVQLATCVGHNFLPTRKS